MADAQVQVDTGDNDCELPQSQWYNAGVLMKEFLRKEKIIIKLQKDQKYKEDRIGNLKRKLGNLNRKIDLLSKLFIKSHSIIFVFLEVENGNYESDQKYKNDRIGNLIGKISDLNETINGLSELFF